MGRTRRVMLCLLGLVLLIASTVLSAPGSAAVPGAPVAVGAGPYSGAEVLQPPTAEASPRPTLQPSPTEGTPRPTLGPGSTDTPPAAQAEICLRLAAEPGSAVVPSQIVTYRLAAHNTGDGVSIGARITLPFTAAAQDVVDASFTNPQAWVSEIRASEVEVRLGPLQSDEIVTATLRLRTKPAAVLGSRLTTRAVVEWPAENYVASRLSNRVSLVVAGVPANHSTVALDVYPAAGTSDATFDFAYSGFSSYERLSRWYHRPDGQVISLEEMTADAQGQTFFSLPATMLPKGSYRMVLFGTCSQLSAAGSFSITPQEATPQSVTR